MRPVRVSFGDIVDSAPWASLKAFRPECVLGIERGGTVLAALVAYRLGARLLTIRASFYDDSKPARRKRDEPEVSPGDLTLLMGKRTLIVDDVSNSGKTLAKVRTAALSAGAAEAKTFVYAGDADFSCRPFERCLVFPWEWEG